MKTRSSLLAGSMVASLVLMQGLPAHAWSLSLTGSQAASTNVNVNYGNMIVHFEKMGDVSLTGGVDITLPEFMSTHANTMQILRANVTRNGQGIPPVPTSVMAWSACNPDLTGAYPANRINGQGPHIQKSWTIPNPNSGAGYSSTKWNYFYLGITGSVSYTPNPNDPNSTIFPSLPYIVGYPPAYSGMKTIGAFTFDNGPLVR